MKVRFQADADLNQIILLATIRREPAIDFQTAMTAGLPGLVDPEEVYFKLGARFNHSKQQVPNVLLHPAILLIWPWQQTPKPNNRIHT